jgi:hypothetical protein
MPPVELEPTSPASARPQTYALDGAATGIGTITLYFAKIMQSTEHGKMTALSHPSTWL